MSYYDIFIPIGYSKSGMENFRHGAEKLSSSPLDAITDKRIRLPASDDAGNESRWI